MTIEIKMDVKCAECRHPGATDSGICLKCVTAAFSGKAMRSQQGRAVQRRICKVKETHNAGAQARSSSAVK